MRAIKGGISSIFDADGNLLAASRMGEEAILRARVEPSSVMTVYTRWGDWVVGLAALLILLRAATCFRERLSLSVPRARP